MRRAIGLGERPGRRHRVLWPHQTQQAQPRPRHERPAAGEASGHDDSPGRSRAKRPAGPRGSQRREAASQQVGQHGLAALIDRQAATIEDELDQALRNIKAYRKTDPGYKQAIKAFIDAEVAFAAEEPMEGSREPRPALWFR